MGMFDSVYIICPHCQHSEEFQTKAGDCLLNVYHQGDSNLPREIVEDLHSYCKYCSDCGNLIKLRKVIKHVPVLTLLAEKGE